MLFRSAFASELNEITRDEAKAILNEFRSVPARFLGGEFELSMAGMDASDFSAIKSLEEFKQIAIPASVIVAVDWKSGATGIVYGSEVFKRIIESGSSENGNVVAFAVTFESELLKRLLASVKVTKGWSEWNGRTH